MHAQVFQESFFALALCENKLTAVSDSESETTGLGEYLFGELAAERLSGRWYRAGRSVPIHMSYDSRQNRKMGAEKGMPPSVLASHVRPLIALHSRGLVKLGFAQDQSVVKKGGHHWQCCQNAEKRHL